MVPLSLNDTPIKPSGYCGITPGSVLMAQPSVYGLVVVIRLVNESNESALSDCSTIQALVLVAVSAVIRYRLMRCMAPLSTPVALSTASARISLCDCQNSTPTDAKNTGTAISSTQRITLAENERRIAIITHLLSPVPSLFLRD